MLSSGVKLYIDQSVINTQSLIYLSDGIEHVFPENIVDSEFEYGKDYYRPRKPWQLGNPLEIQRLLGNSSTNFDTNGIYLLRLPETLVSLLTVMHINSARDKLSLACILKNSSECFAEINDGIKKWIASLLKTNGLFKYRGLYFSPANLETAAYDENHKLVGLHIDNTTFDNAFEEEPEIMRLCINLGKDDRFLLFINKTIRQAIEMIQVFEDIDPIQCNGDILVAKFSRYYPDYPVVKLRQRPFDAYIMPADNIIHDGNTEGQQYVDITMVFHGEFELTATRLHTEKKLHPPNIE